MRSEREKQRGRGESADRRRADGINPAPPLSHAACPFSPISHPLSLFISGRGAVTAIAAGGDAVVVVTARGYLLRYDVAAGGAPSELLERE